MSLAWPWRFFTVLGLGLRVTGLGLGLGLVTHGLVNNTVARVNSHIVQAGDQAVD